SGSSNRSASNAARLLLHGCSNPNFLSTSGGGDALKAENEALHERLERLEKAVQALSKQARHGEAEQRSRNTEN
ncbi:MAG: hypothetical protein VCA34_15795, partial [Roseibacillus sp.]